MKNKDLFYSFPHNLLLQRLRALFESDLVGFLSRSGISVNGCLTLVEDYLTATVVELDEGFPNTLGEKVKQYLVSLKNGITVVARYVDDIILSR